MTILVKHVFQSAKADGPDSTIVQPSDWNDTHNITLAAGKVMGRDTSSGGAVQELPLSFDSTLQSMVPPSGTTAQRPSVPVAGMLRYNTTLAQFEIYRNGAWQPVGSSAYYNAVSPTNPKAGDLWYDSVGGLLMTYTGAAWVAAVVTSAVGLSIIQASTQAAARTAIGVTIGTNVQAWDTDLDGLAALSSTGFISRTGSGTFASRNMAVGAGATITNANGFSGNPTIAVDVAVTADVTAATANKMVDAATFTATKIGQGTSQATTSGTSKDFTSIPSWVKRVTVLLNGFSTNGTSNPLVQIGTGGTPTTTGYNSGAGQISSASTVTVSATNGFILHTIAAATDVDVGRCVIENMGGNVWAMSSIIYTGARVGVGAGTVTLSGTLDNVRLTTVNGTDTFDAGSVNILWE